MGLPRGREPTLAVRLGIPHDVLQEDIVERLNLNLPADARKELHRLARRAKRRDGEYARDLLLKALDEAARDDLARQYAESQTPELARRETEIAESFERLRRG